MPKRLIILPNIQDFPVGTVLSGYPTSIEGEGLLPLKDGFKIVVGYLEDGILFAIEDSQNDVHYSSEFCFLTSEDLAFFCTSARYHYHVDLESKERRSTGSSITQHIVDAYFSPVFVLSKEDGNLKVTLRTKFRRKKRVDRHIFIPFEDLEFFIQD